VAIGHSNGISSDDTVVPMSDTALAIAEDNVAQGRRIVAAQRAKIDSLRVGGRNTIDAERNLAALESTLRVIEDHRDWLRQNGGQL
jgi:hypothetical protein